MDPLVLSLEVPPNGGNRLRLNLAGYSLKFSRFEKAENFITFALMYEEGLCPSSSKKRNYE